VATSSVSPPDPEQDVQDAELPDPSRLAIRWAAAFLAAAIAVALLADFANLDKDPPFDPKSVPGGGVAIFAGFLAASVVIERMLELASPFIPWWNRRTTGLAAIDQKKADRGYVLVTLAQLLGVLAKSLQKAKGSGTPAG
jgi:hypothetical protein